MAHWYLGLKKLAYDDVQKVGHPYCRGSGACIPRALIFRQSQRTEWGQTHEFIEKDRQKNAYEKLRVDDFIQNY